MKFIENRWMRAAVPALLIHCSIGSVYCWSSFSGALAEFTGTSRSALGWAFSIAIFFLGMSAAFAGKFVEHDIKKSSLISCICFTIGMVGTGLCILFNQLLGPTLTTLGFYLFYGCIMGIGLGVGYITPVKTLMLWFDKSKGLATGISIMGFGLAKAIASPVMNALQGSVGLANMFFILAAAYFVMMLAAHFLIRKPAGWVESTEKSDFRLSSMFRSKTFVGVWLMFYINITCGLALISFEKPILQLAGFGAVAISTIQAVTAAANALGRIGLSTISDKCRDRNTIYKIIFAFSVAAVVLSLATGAIGKSIYAIIVILLVLVNTGYGGGFSTLPALLSSRFGMKNISQIHGLALSAWAFAGLSGNQLTNFMLGRFGSYESVLIVLLVLYAAAFLISTFLVSAKGDAVLCEKDKKD